MALPFTQHKAKEVLSEKRPTLKGHLITKKQRGLLGLIAGGKTPTRMSPLKKEIKSRIRK